MLYILLTSQPDEVEKHHYHLCSKLPVSNVHPDLRLRHTRNDIAFLIDRFVKQSLIKLLKSFNKKVLKLKLPFSFAILSKTQHTYIFNNKYLGYDCFVLKTE